MENTKGRRKISSSQRKRRHRKRLCFATGAVLTTLFFNFGVTVSHAQPLEENDPLPFSTQRSATPLTDAVETYPTGATEPAGSQVLERYRTITMTDEEYEELAKIIWLEARNQCFQGQQAVAEVVFNRVINERFPDTVGQVLHEGENSSCPQFSPIGYLYMASLAVIISFP